MHLFPCLIVNLNTLCASRGDLRFFLVSCDKHWAITNNRAGELSIRNSRIYLRSQPFNFAQFRRVNKRNANKLFTILSCLGFCGWIVPVDPKISELRDAKILVEEEKFLDVDINIKTEADDVLEPPKAL